ncbi:MAG: preprotein translocase subunit SecG [Rhodospirillales bacterium]|nr:preprotein translocase subunit SecG [Rhodospirillales bacterium]
MLTVVLVIHILIAIAMVGTVLLQRSEGGALGMGGGGGGGGMGGFMTGRATANILTRATGILAAGFFVTSMTLAIMSGSGREASSIMDSPAATAPATEAPAEPAGPAAPLAK